MLLQSAPAPGAWERLLAVLKEWDFAVFLKINTVWTGAFGDFLMPILRDQRTWYPLYAFLLIYAIYKFRWKALPFIIMAGLTVVLTDQVSSSFFKNYFGRTRPCNEEALRGIMRLLLDRCPSSGSFTSSHAVNHFGLATFIYITLKPYFGKWGLLFFLWAAFICYAQVYVGVHYPGDVSAGAVLGVLLGWLTAWIFKKYFNFGVRKTGHQVPRVTGD